MAISVPDRRAEPKTSRSPARREAGQQQRGEHPGRQSGEHGQQEVGEPDARRLFPTAGA
jgi:hypothetical protein